MFLSRPGGAASPRSSPAPKTFRVHLGSVASCQRSSAKSAALAQDQSTLFLEACSTTLFRVIMPDAMTDKTNLTRRHFLHRATASTALAVLWNEQPLSSLGAQAFSPPVA